MQKRDYNTEQRRAMAERNEALPDGSFPIANEADLKAAMQSIGRAKDPERAKAHIRRRAKALGLSDMLTPAFKPGKVSKGDVYADLWDPPDLPIPCTPADLTPAMSATMPAPMQDQFCAVWNALAAPIPDGAGMDDDRAFGLAMDLLCYQHGWTRRPDGSYARIAIVADGMEYGEEEEGMEKAGRVLSAANEAKVRAAMDALAGLLATVETPPEEEGMGKAAPVSITFDLEKMAKNDEKMQVFGYGYVCKGDDGETVVDLSQDVVDMASLEQAAYAGFSKLFAGHMHKGEAPASIITLSWSDPEIRKVQGAVDPGKKVGLWTGFQVHDKGFWKDIKSGKIAAFSIGGKGVRSPIS